MTREDALAQLRAKVEPGRAERMAGYHKVERSYLCLLYTSDAADE